MSRSKISSRVNFSAPTEPRFRARYLESRAALSFAFLRWYSIERLMVCSLFASYQVLKYSFLASGCRDGCSEKRCGFSLRHSLAWRRERSALQSSEQTVGGRPGLVFRWNEHPQTAQTKPRTIGFTGGTFLATVPCVLSRM